MKTILNSELIHLPSAKPVGVPDPNEVIRVSVVLRPKAKSALPIGSAPLAREQFAAAYGADAAAIASVESFATNNGLVVLESHPDRRTVVLSGTTAAMATAFSVRFVKYAAGSVNYRAYEGPISVPDDLAPIVVAVLGLDTRPAATPHLRVGQLGPFVPGGPYSPSELATAYDFPTGNQGAGQCIGIIELGGGFLQSDLQSFFGGLSLPVPQVVVVPVDGATNAPGGGIADFEVGLDIEVAGAIASQARIAVYFAPNTLQGFLDAITTAIHDAANRPSVVSISWGSTEDLWPRAFLTAFDQAFQAAGVLGVTVFAASGDDGSEDRDPDGSAHVDFPASSPNVVGCGGTTLVANGPNIQSEVVWNNFGSTGGGISDIFPIPSFQAAAGVPLSANPSHNAGRGVPDVSGNADPQTGYACFIHGSPVILGGTSAVAPLWAALTALINASRRGSSVGFINPVLYGHPGAFHDIVSGNNDVGNLPYFYQAGPGWDACTGWGSPNGQQIANAFPPPVATISLNASDYELPAAAPGGQAGIPKDATLMSVYGQAFTPNATIHTTVISGGRHVAGGSSQVRVDGTFSWGGSVFPQLPVARQNSVPATKAKISPETARLRAFPRYTEFGQGFGQPRRYLYI